MATFQVKNLRTGRTVEMKQTAVDALKRQTGWKKKYDIVGGPKVKNVPEKPKKKAAPKTEAPQEEGTPEVPAEVPEVQKTNKKRSVKEMITAISACESVEAIDLLIFSEKRRTVIQAANAKKKDI